MTVESICLTLIVWAAVGVSWLVGLTLQICHYARNGISYLLKSREEKERLNMAYWTRKVREKLRREQL